VESGDKLRGNLLGLFRWIRNVFSNFHCLFASFRCDIVDKGESLIGRVFVEVETS
jgi:hypothetical protein